MKLPHINPFLTILKKVLSKILLLGVLGLAAAPFAQGQVSVTFTEVGDDVVSTYSGSFNRSDWPTTVPSGSVSQIFSMSYYNFKDIPYDHSSQSTVTSTGDTWTGPPGTNATSATGDAFGFDIIPSGFLYVPTGYTSGDSISGSMTFENKSFSSLNLIDGNSGTLSYAGGGSVSWAVGTAVPEPSSFACIAGFAVFGLVMSRRRGRGPTAQA